MSEMVGFIYNELIVSSTGAKQLLGLFNLSKTKAIFLLTNVLTQKPVLELDNVSIEFVDYHKQVCVTLSQNGKWREHLNNLSNSAAKNKQYGNFT